MNERAIFEAALERKDPDQRSAYLDVACAGDPSLRRQIEGLLEAHEMLGSFLASPPPAPAVALSSSPGERGAKNEGVSRTIGEPISEGPGTVIGPYKLLEQIGGGGFGVVFMAEQQQPIRRKVALKVLKPGMDTRQVVARFEAERQTLALMGHPNIAHVFDGGATTSGRPYFVMELVRGVPVTDFCDQNKLSIPERLKLFIDVCQAVQHAHQKGIIHRDIKPSNVLVTLHDDRAVVKVIDFGIAKATGQQLTEKTLFTNFAQMIGTPLYMSPEQARMTSLDVDTRSDVYSLGVLLYELMTGTTPFEKERLRTVGFDEIRRIIREEEPPKPSTRISTLGQAATTVSTQRRSDPKRLSQFCRGELDWIVMKALEKDRNRRYETASAFVADVQRYLHDEPVQACPPSAWYRCRVFARRHKAGLVTAALVTLALVAGTGISLWQAIRATDAVNSEQQALLDLDQELRHTQEAKDKATRELFDSLLAQARANRLSRRIGQRFGTFEILDRAIAIARQLKLPAERFLEMRNEALAAMALTDLRVDKEWTSIPGTALDFDLVHQRYARANPNGTVYVRRVGDDAEICRLPAPGSGEYWLDFSPDGSLLAVMHPERARVQVWRLARKETAEFSNMSAVMPGKEPVKVLDEAWRTGGLTFSRDGRQIALQQPDRSIAIFDLATGKTAHRLALVGGADRIAFNPKGRQLAIVSQGAAQVHDLQTGQVLWKQPLSGRHSWLEWHPDGKTLAVGESMDGGEVISLWDVAVGKQIGKLEGAHGGGVLCAFNHTGTLLASTGRSGVIRLWNPLTRRELFSTSASEFTLRFSPDDRFLAATEHGNNLRILEIAAEGEYRTITGNLAGGNRTYHSSAISADGRLLAAGASGGVGLSLWDLPSGKPLTLSQDSPACNFVLWESSGALLTMGQNGLYRQTIRREQATGLVQVGSPKKLWVDGVSKRIVNRVAQSRDGRVLACALDEGGVVLHSDQPDRHIVLGPHVDAQYVAVSPDGQWVATGVLWHPGGAKVWRARTGKLVKDLPVGAYCWVVFSQDGKRLLTDAGGASPHSGQIRAWEVGTWAEIPFKEPLKGANPEFSPDGKLLVVETGTGVARLLDPKTGGEYARLEDPSRDRTGHFTFSPDSTKLVCATADGNCLHIWDLRALRRRLADMGLDWESPP